MAYDEKLAQRIRSAQKGSRLVSEKKMFGGIAFLRKGHMFAGVSGSSPMARVGLKTEAQVRFWLERCKRFVATLPAKAR
jgi:TfoX/Sxy family transcriptional regulator of competence genes